MGEYIMRNRFSFPLIALFMLAYAFSLPAFAGTITLTSSNKVFKINSIPPFMEELIADGGLMKHIAGKRGKNEKR